MEGENEIKYKFCKATRIWIKYFLECLFYMHLISSSKSNRNIENHTISANSDQSSNDDNERTSFDIDENNLYCEENNAPTEDDISELVRWKLDVLGFNVITYLLAVYVYNPIWITKNNI